MDFSLAGFSFVLIKVILLLIALVLSAIYLYTKWTHSYWKKRGVPHEKPYPIVGNLQFLMRKSLFDYFHDLAKKFPEDFVGIYLGHKPTLVLQTPELARNVLSRDTDHFEDRYLYGGNSDPLGRYNLFTIKMAYDFMTMTEPALVADAPGMLPLFTSARLRILTELMNGNAKELVSKIDHDHVQQHNKVSLKNLFLMYASDTVGFTVFGLRTSALSGKDSPLWLITRTMVNYTFLRGFEFTMIFLVPIVAQIFRFKFFSATATEYVRKLFWNVVEGRKKAKSNTEKDLVNLLLKFKENVNLPGENDPALCENLMLAQAALFIFGSVDTSSTTLSYCLYELAHHPEAQEKMFREVDEAIKSSGKDILDYDDLIQLRYLTSCIQETLRKHPPVPYLDRICNKDYQLTDSQTIKAGTPVFVNVLAIHRNAKHYPEPEEWRPERFNRKNESDNRQYTFLPFGEGPRFCIGKRYGMIQMQTALAQVIHRFRVEPETGSSSNLLSDPYSLQLAPIGGAQLKFVPRN